MYRSPKPSLRCFEKIPFYAKYCNSIPMTNKIPIDKAHFLTKNPYCTV